MDKKELKVGDIIYKRDTFGSSLDKLKVEEINDEKAICSYVACFTDKDEDDDDDDDFDFEHIHQKIDLKKEIVDGKICRFKRINWDSTVFYFKTSELDAEYENKKEEYKKKKIYKEERFDNEENLDRFGSSDADIFWEKLVIRYSKDREICNCGNAYLSVYNDNDDFDLEFINKKCLKNGVPTCKWGCEINKHACRNYIAKQVLKDLVEYDKLKKDK